MAQEIPVLMTVSDLTRTFRSDAGEVTAVKHLNFEIYKNRLVIFRGKSGSGKTTLINLLGTLDRPTSGSIWMEGEDLCALPDRRRDQFRREKVGFVYQSIALLNQMTAQENVEFRLRLCGYDPKQRAKRASECLEMVGLQGKGKHYPDQLSGGEQQRVAIARAIAPGPSVLFADEPTAQLDTAMSMRIVKIFKDLIASQDITVVMTTHDVEMMEIADEVFTLQDGEIIDRN